jgi:S-methylmethionine-dependent homocysteine/selenocysteine methylase
MGACRPVETPQGQAIDTVDATTDRGPAYYMINCAHPTHFEDALETGREPGSSASAGLRRERLAR